MIEETTIGALFIFSGLPGTGKSELARDLSRRAGADFRDIEVVCSDEAEHRRRVESRESQVPGLKLPTWQEVVDRKYEAWERERIIVDTAERTPEQSKQALIRALAATSICP